MAIDTHTHFAVGAWSELVFQYSEATDRALNPFFFFQVARRNHLTPSIVVRQALYKTLPELYPEFDNLYRSNLIEAARTNAAAD